MKDLEKRLLKACMGGIKAGIRTGWWISKMMLPITLGVAFLKWFGVIGYLTDWLSPLFKYIGLTGEGVLVFITSIFASLYGAIAVIATLDMDYRSVTILAVMGLLCHNLIIETVIQRKAGARAWPMVALRIGAAIFAAGVLNLILPMDYSGTLILDHIAAMPEANSVGEVISGWALSMIQLLPFMFALILSLNILQHMLREFSLVEVLTRPVAPLMKLMGLPRETSLLWIVMNTLGLAYGGSVLIEEIGHGEIGKRSAKLLNTHIALTHSLVEDTFLFLAIGVGLFWLVVPRLLLSIVAVWVQRGYYEWSDRKRNITATCSIQ